VAVVADQRCRRLIPLNATAAMAALAVAVVVKDMELQAQPAVLVTHRLCLRLKVIMAAQAQPITRLVMPLAAAAVHLLLAVME